MNRAKIAAIAKSFGAKVPFMRSDKNADDYATTAEVINEVIYAYDYKDLNYENYSFSKQKWTALPVFSIRNTKVDALRKMKEPLRRKAMLKLSAFLQKK